MKIVIYGGHGYQGRLVLAELARHDTEIVLAGRNAGRLEAAAAAASRNGTGTVTATRVADSADHDALVAAFRDADAVINCAGPFTPQGAAVARAAVAAGCHYTDTSGEQFHVKEVYDACAADAERAGVRVTPAMTDGGVPGDLLARILAEHLGGGPLEEVLAGHLVTGASGMSRGSLRSLSGTADVLRTGGLAYEKGEWRGDAEPRLTAIDFPGRPGTPVIRFALQEVVTVPRHLDVTRVQGFAEAGLAELFATTVSEEAIAAMPEGPSDEERRGDHWTIVVQAVAQNGRRARASAQGPDTYGTTGVIAALGTLRMNGPAGGRTPAEVLDPAGFLDALAPYGITWTVDG
ncbi:saccharopine dehydrogenase NADP-binding domain-containing protein [Actinomadura rugatobispora]|uniref:Saccharopine dehydrogenase NADP-binding domain-containing protein n=1 Tax=Actinomadura rugatobispora TaxID=1994 RepID=A0ABW1AJM9_9ACTN|nr:saccharopine dehydrogenase NADP-binding domain-containing protein [Actinomadura rugatobispora]